MERFPLEASVIGRKGARTALQIIAAWRDLFCHSPNPMQLTGKFVFRRDSANGEYEKLRFSREDLLVVFSKLLRMLSCLETENKCLCVTAWTDYDRIC